MGASTRIAASGVARHDVRLAQTRAETSAIWLYQAKSRRLLGDRENRYAFHFHGAWPRPQQPARRGAAAGPGQRALSQPSLRLAVRAGRSVMLLNLHGR